MNNENAFSELSGSVSRETLEMFGQYENLLVRWSARINLVSPASLKAIWSRHFLDSAQLLEFAPADCTHWADFGSGGGFPGIVIALMKKGSPNFQVSLVEADQRKSAFLRTVIRECDLTAKVITQRIENVSPLCADVVSARALAPLSSLLNHAEKHLSANGVAIFPKGARADIEVADAQKKWSFSHEAFPSKTDARATVLKIGDIKRV